MSPFEIEVSRARELLERVDLPAHASFDFRVASSHLVVDGRRYPAGDVVTVTCTRASAGVEGREPELLWEQIYRANHRVSWLFAFAEDLRARFPVDSGRGAAAGEGRVAPARELKAA